MGVSKVIIVTGSSRGIGAELLRGFAKQGHKVVLNYSKSDEEANAVLNEINAFSQDIIKIKADISSRSDVKNMFDEIISRFGHVDALINNASLNIDDSFLNMTDDKWKKVLDVNLTGTFICSQEFMFHFKGNDGHIVNLAAATAIQGRKNGANYCSAKAGVISLTKCLALELAPIIKVNCVCPGHTNTAEVIERYHLNDKEKLEEALKTIPLGRIGTAQDVFNTINFIINDSTNITGQNFFVNGGYYMG